MRECSRCHLESGFLLLSVTACVLALTAVLLSVKLIDARHELRGLRSPAGVTGRPA